MKNLIIMLLFTVVLLMSTQAQSVIRLRDPHFTNQLKRMVVQEWADFLPKPRNFLGVNMNPHYTATWSWAAPTQNRRYRSGADIRPLGPTGNQTQRQLMMATLSAISNDYKKQADSLGSAAENEIIQHSSVTVPTDPLYRIYYSHELRKVRDYVPGSPESVLSPEVIVLLNRLTGALQDFDEEMSGFQESYNLGYSANMERGERLIHFHGILYGYRELMRRTNSKVKFAERSALIKQKTKVDGAPTAPPSTSGKNDVERMRAIIQRTRIKD